MKYSETIDAGIQKTERNLNAEQADIEAREVRILSNASEREVAMGGMNKVKKYVAIGTIAAFGGFFAAKALSKEDPNPYGNSARLDIYNYCRTNNIQYWCFDRGNHTRHYDHPIHCFGDA